MTRLVTSLITTLVALAPSAALAHPDHFSSGSHGLLHVLTDPFHLAMAAGAILAAVFVARRVRAESKIR